MNGRYIKKLWGTCRACGTHRPWYHRRLCVKCFNNHDTRAKYPRIDYRAPQGLADFEGPTLPPPAPTDYPQGSAGKVAVLQQRAQQGLSLHHPVDCREWSEGCVAIPRHGKGQMTDDNQGGGDE